MTQLFEHLELPKTVELKGTTYELVKNGYDLLLIADNREGLCWVEGLTIIFEEALLLAGSVNLANTYFSASDIKKILEEEFHRFLITKE